jgi:SET domain-containing protein
LKEKLIQLLQNETLIGLKPSPVHGIGVFALADIPKGTKNLFSKGFGEWIRISFEDVAALPEQSIALIDNFCLYDDKDYFIPEYGFKLMDLVVYLNHSDTPNLISVDEGAYFETSCDIRCGEELFVDYGTLVDE